MINPMQFRSPFARTTSISAAAAAALTLFAVPAAAQEGHMHALGSVDFGVSCAPAVAAEFDASVALLHHMQYEEARAGFERVAAADPACGMAQWGVAMTLFQPLWPSRPSADDLRRGWAAVQKARTLGSLSEREAALVDAAEAFYREPDAADWWTRIGRWSEAMERAHAAHPDDIETAALHALSQLAAGQVAEDRMALHGRASRVLLGIYEREPTHPGAVHYTIHANDVDARAGEDREVVGSYSAIAPDVPHALHMPTHIFVRLGAWPEVIEWNAKSAAAALKYPAGSAISHHYVHALDYLVYAHLQRGEDAKARAILDGVTGEDASYQPSFISAFHLASMPARYAVERRDWDEARKVAPTTPAALPWHQFWWPEAISWFARGLGAAHAGDAAEAERAEARMTALRDAATGAGEQTFATYIEVDRLVLTAARAHVAGRGEQALDLARRAARLEGTVEKHPVTPGALYPAQEALGDLLLAMDEPAAALAAYEGALATWPGRYNSLLGAARAARAAGQDARARSHYEDLLEVTAGSMSGRPGVAEARAAVGR